MSDAAIAQRLLRCLDLTDLGESGSDHATDELCAQATNPLGPVAAVCVWPQMVSRARAALQGSPVRIATVVNFPHGGEDVERVMDDIVEALDDGAEEIDLVLPCRALLRGEPGPARDMVAAARDVVDQGRMLKVILETGALATAAMIKQAGELAVAAGGDFLKTSTGRTATSATPEAAEAMLGVIAAAGRPVGLKVSGGVRTLAAARVYLDLAEGAMGPGWATPSTFRIGASALYAALVDAIEGATTDRAPVEGIGPRLTSSS